MSVDHAISLKPRETIIIVSGKYFVCIGCSPVKELIVHRVAFLAKDKER